jgi:hypothetical protein
MPDQTAPPPLVDVVAVFVAASAVAPEIGPATTPSSKYGGSALSPGGAGFDPGSGIAIKTENDSAGVGPSIVSSVDDDDRGGLCGGGGFVEEGRA